jgi:signal transduction histidine kinase
VESAAVLSTLYGRFIEVWRQKEAIVQRNRLTRLLIRNTGHEVRTPLNSIINYLEVALEESLDERSRFHLQRSLQASKSVVAVVNDLLTFTEAEDVDLEVHEDNIDLRVMLSEVMDAFKDESSRRGLTFQQECDPAIPRILRGDPNGLRQVLSNLLTNAIQNSESGKIYISVNHVKTTGAQFVVKVAFRDERVGLSEHELDSIFQDFEQILDEDETLSKDGREKAQHRPLGIGLGLATAARFVRLNYGQIIMSSDGLGKGTTVSVTMPFSRSRVLATV